MKLLITDRSPFARKCRAVAHAKGITGQLELQEVDIFGKSDELRAINPLGKIPVLIKDDGTRIIDSPVICEYFDITGQGAKLIPQAEEERFSVLHLAALGDGMLDSAVEIVLESMRPREKQYDVWLDKHKGNLLRGAELLQNEYMEELTGESVNMAKLTVAITLDYITHRLDGIGHNVNWRSASPDLSAWLDDWLQHPALRASAPRQW